MQRRSMPDGGCWASVCWRLRRQLSSYQLVGSGGVKFWQRGTFSLLLLGWPGGYWHRWDGWDWWCSSSISAIGSIGRDRATTRNADHPLFDPRSAAELHKPETKL